MSPLIKSKFKKSEEKKEPGKAKDLALAMSVQRAAKKKKMAEGGAVQSAEEEGTDRAMENMRHGKKLDFTNPDEGMTLESIKKENYADGGEVDLSENAEEEPNEYYELNKEAAHKELYDLESQLHDHESMAQAIRRKMAAKRG